MTKIAVEKVHEINADVALREKIFQRDKALRDYENGIESARLEGLTKGRAEGRAEGRTETLKALIAGGMDEKLIKKILGL